MADQAEFIHQFSIQKAFPNERGGAIRILIKASTEDKDRVGETILKSAYADSQMRNDFIREGYLDYNHLTDFIDNEIAEKNPSTDRLAELQKAKIAAIIGFPLLVGTRDEFPSEYKLVDDGFYIMGSLIPGNQYAEEIRKGLEAGWNGWGASVSGKALKSDFDSQKRLKRIYLRKCAIQPKSESINGNTSVQLLKSKLVLLRDVQKSLFASSDELPSEGDYSYLPEEVENLRKKYNILHDFLKNDPVANERFLLKIFSDISNRVYNKTLPLRSHIIRKCLSGEYGIDGDVLDDMADTFFIKLSGEQNV